MPSYTYNLLRDELVRDEGIKLSAYQDSRGFWTIGVGRLIDARRGGKLSEAEAHILLSNDIAAAEQDLDRNIPWWRTKSDGVQRALLNLVFNMGWPTLSGFKKFLGALERGGNPTAADELLDSDYANQTGQRAQRIAELIRAG